MNLRGSEFKNSSILLALKCVAISGRGLRNCLESSKDLFLQKEIYRGLRWLTRVEISKVVNIVGSEIRARFC